MNLPPHLFMSCAAGCVAMGVWFVVLARQGGRPRAWPASVVGFALGALGVVALLARSEFQANPTEYAMRWVSAAPAIVLCAVVLMHVAVHHGHTTLQGRSTQRVAVAASQSTPMNAASWIGAALVLPIVTLGPWLSSRLIAEQRSGSETIGLAANPVDSSVVQLTTQWNDPVAGATVETVALPYWPSLSVLAPTLAIASIAVMLCFTLRWQEGNWTSAAFIPIRSSVVAALWMFAGLWLAMFADNAAEHPAIAVGNPLVVSCLQAGAAAISFGAWIFWLASCWPITTAAHKAASSSKLFSFRAVQRWASG